MVWHTIDTYLLYNINLIKINKKKLSLFIFSFLKKIHTLLIVIDILSHIMIIFVSSHPTVVKMKGLLRGSTFFAVY